MCCTSACCYDHDVPTCMMHDSDAMSDTECCYVPRCDESVYCQEVVSMEHQSEVSSMVTAAVHVVTR